MSNPIPTAPPSGFRDHMPDACELRARAIETISRVYRARGFQQIATSAVEDLAVLLGKGGGENEKLIFKIMKRGEKLSPERVGALLGDPTRPNIDYREIADQLADLGLRFDLTLPLARFYSKYGSTLPRPFKAFNIGPVWRAERTQKGRYREFYQCDVDIVGTDAWAAEVEVISAIVAAFQAFGLSDVEVVLNDRTLVYEAMRLAGIPDDKHAAACIIIDKLDKIGIDKVRDELKDAVGHDETAHLQQTLLSQSGAFAGEQLERLNSVINGVRKATGHSGLRIDPSLMRGFDYYTGAVFEFRHPSFKGSIGGGGRYDKLTEKFGGPQTPACGGSIGFERLLDILSQRSDARSRAGKRVCLLIQSEEMRGYMLDIAQRLLRANIPDLVVDVYPGEVKARMDIQSKYAKNSGAHFSLIAGPDEANSDLIRRHDISNGDEKVLPFDDLAASLRAD
jgi:histidyl-tRNA synthetase